MEKAKILVIEDEAENREILKELLSKTGYEVTTARNGKEGIALFQKSLTSEDEPYDLVLTDLGMPEISGWEVARVIKKLAPKVPIAMITGWGVQIKKEELKGTGVDLLLAKPFELKEVLDLVAQAAGRKKEK